MRLYIYPEWGRGPVCTFPQRQQPSSTEGPTRSPSLCKEKVMVQEVIYHV